MCPGVCLREGRIPPTICVKWSGYVLGSFELAPILFEVFRKITRPGSGVLRPPSGLIGKTFRLCPVSGIGKLVIIAIFVRVPLLVLR